MLAWQPAKRSGVDYRRPPAGKAGHANDHHRCLNSREWSRGGSRGAWLEALDNEARLSGCALRGWPRYLTPLTT
ncbi:hypothetical protein LNQ03_03345 [Klebsiella pneumoniae subsp. pneumoniae]|nr:hypothetical protein [Klebsiella pneumoniae subsp. pneumoniae]